MTLAIMLKYVYKYYVVLNSLLQTSLEDSLVRSDVWYRGNIR